MMREFTAAEAHDQLQLTRQVQWAFILATDGEEKAQRFWERQRVEQRPALFQVALPIMVTHRQPARGWYPFQRPVVVPHFDGDFATIKAVRMSGGILGFRRDEVVSSAPVLFARAQGATVVLMGPRNTVEWEMQNEAEATELAGTTVVCPIDAFVYRENA